MSVQGTAGVPSLSVGPMAEGGPTRVEPSRRGSVAANLSITQGLPVDLDRIDMDDDDDDYDDEESERLDASSFDGDIDEDSMAADDNEGSLGYAASSHGGCRASDCNLLDPSDRTRALRSGPLDMPGLAGRRQSATVPRNKAFLRLLSLVEDDRQPLASEMEHEGQITRTIRHTNVQEWLRSSSAHLNQPKTPDDQMACSSSPTVVATAGLASPLRNQPGFTTAPAAITSSSAPARDILFPTSPALSSVSSLQMNTTSLATLAVSTARPAKRKSIDDGGGSVSPAESFHTQGSSRSMHPYKRLAMSPSGLRAQIAIGKNGRSIALPVSRSGPSSPLLVSRPVALPITLPSAASVVTSRARSRSNGGMGPGGLSVLQANGGFSRMNLDDKMYENSC
ncbi:hypothetical protein LPJ66_009734 [Kickxella alabastrina]|uniref:Uncharacterized protein n=1 Tax=Kickxella alabastrina TaxID=61397 RepID=A0ACC1I6P9_9FUNG|nr:hypothetical protein LPJ66_009734 [Kickxella alabastrina]